MSEKSSSFQNYVPSRSARASHRSLPVRARAFRRSRLLGGIGRAALRLSPLILIGDPRLAILRFRVFSRRSPPNNIQRHPSISMTADVRSRPASMACIIESAQTFSPQQFSQRLVKSQYRFILLLNPAQACKQKLLTMRRRVDKMF